MILEWGKKLGVFILYVGNTFFYERLTAENPVLVSRKCEETLLLCLASLDGVRSLEKQN